MAKSAAEMTRGAFQRARGRSALVHYLATSAGGFAVYAVGSTADPDHGYRVTVRGSEFRCTCPAADGGQVACWHRAIVASVRANRQGFGLEPDGPAPGQAAPLGRVAPRRLPPQGDAA